MILYLKNTAYRYDHVYIHMRPVDYCPWIKHHAASEAFLRKRYAVDQTYSFQFFLYLFRRGVLAVKRNGKWYSKNAEKRAIFGILKSMYSSILPLFEWCLSHYGNSFVLLKYVYIISDTYLFISFTRIK